MRFHTNIPPPCCKEMSPHPTLRWWLCHFPLKKRRRADLRTSLTLLWLGRRRQGCSYPVTSPRACSFCLFSTSSLQFGSWPFQLTPGQGEHAHCRISLGLDLNQAEPGLPGELATLSCTWWLSGKKLQEKRGSWETQQNKYLVQVPLRPKAPLKTSKYRFRFSFCLGRWGWGRRAWFRLVSGSVHPLAKSFGQLRSRIEGGRECSGAQLRWRWARGRRLMKEVAQHNMILPHRGNLSWTQSMGRTEEHQQQSRPD